MAESEPTPQEKFARLLALSAIQEARIKANPTPFLNKVAEENYRLRNAIDEALYQMSGASSFDIARKEMPHMPASIVETATMRLRRAQEILAAAIRQDNPNEQDERYRALAEMAEEAKKLGLE